MTVTDTPLLKSFTRLCEDGFRQGWHEANGGNLSYRMTGEDVAACEPEFSFDRPWVEMGVQANNLKSSFFLVTGAGKFLHNAPLCPADCLGILQINDAGNAWRIVWGLENGGKPTSEFPTHFMNHSVRLAATDGANRVIYHAHCPNIITLSTLVEPDARTWTRILWKSMTECVLVFPQGVGVVPWMVPGGSDIAQATAKLMESHDAVVWTQHGMFVSGDTFDAAFGMMHVIEKSAGLYLAARAANGGNEPAFPISDDQLLQVCRAFDVRPREGFLAR
ncbi:MAG TPA: rhamnulose-1-phosphate aldolase [Candidatus Aphodovivens excrementavium]|nr:rhamnulose-1-phosphate aldolase [Candidatus Aphodovivens excrementavium]